jgi:predicted HTH transcriptional regulator
MRVDNIFEILKARNFQELVGIAESLCLDCKSEPYRLVDEKGRHELAKDVSAFANSDGGVLLIGLKTRKESTNKMDVIDKVRVFDKCHFDPFNINLIIESWIFHRIHGLSVEWHDDTERRVWAVLNINTKTTTNK